MGSLQAESQEKQEMDDSGCIQDETPPSKRTTNGIQGVQLLDLSDDVLLLILRYLAPRDLRALGYTCPRLGALILDRSLWQRVDARGQPWGRARLRWYLARALHAGTRELLVSGHAREARECLGHVNQTREEIEAAKLAGDKENGKERDNNNETDEQEDRFTPQRVIDVPALGPNAQLYIDDQRPESPEAFAWPRPSDPLISDSTCPGPQFTLTQNTLRQLTDTCPHLETLALEYCNINCNCTNIGMFPPTLKKLSLRGSKCYNLPLDRSFLFKIQDSLPGLESLDVSECEWLEPASLLPLSKLPNLKHLLARDCLRLTEFVAYASLATRYGFTKLQSLDLRGSPVGDSEVSALGWLTNLRQLWLSPALPVPCQQQHSHHKRDCLPSPATSPRDQWEMQEPEYFKLKESDCDSTKTPEKTDENKHTWQAKLNGNATDFNSTTVLSSTPNPITPGSSNHTPPTMIINASPMRPGNPITSLSLSPNITISPRPTSNSSSNITISGPNSSNSGSNITILGPNSSNSGSNIAISGPNSSNSRSNITISGPDSSNSASNITLSRPKSSNSGSNITISGPDSSNSASNITLSRPKSSNSGSNITIPGSNSSNSGSNIAISGPKSSNSGSNITIPGPKSSNSGSNITIPGPNSSNSGSNITISKNPSNTPQKCCAIITPSRLRTPKTEESKSLESPGPSKAPKRKTSSPKPGPSKRKRDDSSSDDDDVPLKCLVKKEEGRSGGSKEQEEEAEENEEEEDEAPPRHHVLYVNVGQRLHAVYRLSLDNEHVVSFNRHSNLNRIDTRNLFLSPPGSHLDASSLVTDSAIRRFGRADGEDINYVHIGPNGPYPGAQVPGARPDRSSLTHLSVTGFRTITDRSLDHLATSAPLLRFLDLSRTNVTDAGVAAFRTLRPDCVVIYSKYQKD